MDSDDVRRDEQGVGATEENPNVAIITVFSSADPDDHYAEKISNKSILERMIMKGFTHTTANRESKLTIDDLEKAVRLIRSITENPLICPGDIAFASKKTVDEVGMGLHEHPFVPDNLIVVLKGENAREIRKIIKIEREK